MAEYILVLKEAVICHGSIFVYRDFLYNSKELSKFVLVAKST